MVTVTAEHLFIDILIEKKVLKSEIFPPKTGTIYPRLAAVLFDPCKRYYYNTYCKQSSSRGQRTHLVVRGSGSKISGFSIGYGGGARN